MQTNPHISSFDAPSRADETGFLTVSVPADVLTPVSAYLTLRRHTRGSFLFESVEGGERLARYSFIGIDPETIIESGGGAVTLSRAGDTVRAPGDVFAAIREVLAACPPTTGAQAPPFSGGLVGYIGYDEVRAIERIPYSVPDPTGAPDSMLGMFRTTLVFDHRDHTISIVSVPPAAPGLGSEAQRGRTAERLTELRDLLRNPITSGSSFCAGDSAGDGPSVPSDFDDTASIALEHIRAGDIFQVVLSCRNRVAYEGDPFSVYRTLRMINPSPYHFYLDFGTVQLLGSSPEMLVKKSGVSVEHVPIAGTRPRGSTPEEDDAAASELASDGKERAEHIMLVDLGRNDLSKICETGSVRAERFMIVERFSHVMHLVSRVTGTALPGIDGVDALRAVFPAGTVSGAPKIRAMEIIDTLENLRRGFYAGAVGYFDGSGNVDFCIAIRTMMAYGGFLHLQAGAGIVAESVPSREREEIVNKMRVLYEAVRRAEGIDR